MQVQISTKSVKTMVAKLRGEFPDLKASKARELLSDLLGYPTWDAMSAAIKRSESVEELVTGVHTAEEVNWMKTHGWKQTAPVVTTPVKLYIQTGVISDNPVISGPSFAQLTLQQSLLDQIQEAQTRVLQSGLEAVHIPVGHLLEWDKRGTDWALQFASLAVAEGHCYIVAYPKHAGFSVESHLLFMSDLREALSSAPDHTKMSTSIGWADGVLFYSDDGAQEFARGLYYNEVIDIEESCIDQMPN